MVDNEVELAGRHRTGRPRKACATCRRAKRRCTHAVEGLEESGLVALTSGLSLSPRNEVADQAEVNANTRGLPSPSFPPSPPSQSSSHAASSAPPPPLPSENTITMANKKKNNNKRGLHRVPKGANTINTAEAGVEKIPSTTTSRSSTAASRARIPDLPEDALRAAVAMSVHRVYARELQRLLHQFEIQFKTLLETEGPKPAMEEAWEAVRETGDTIHVTVEEWVTK